MTKTAMTANFLRFKTNEIGRLEGHLRAAIEDLEAELARISSDLGKGQSVHMLNLLSKSARVHEYGLRLTALKEVIAELSAVLDDEPADAGEVAPDRRTHEVHE